ncbi:MAG: hypothetical protein OEM42_09615 [Deltaproteobacteria bacterium]|nr:hypothetical protein [Deltaproteobacteria bacterium]MDH3384304.1 hypothetical protein [Deltaproteobacteria bacterium]
MSSETRIIPRTRPQGNAKEFQWLYAELGKRTEDLKAAVKESDLPKSAVAYGRGLEICATCHKKFRDG